MFINDDEIYKFNETVVKQFQPQTLNESCCIKFFYCIQSTRLTWALIGIIIIIISCARGRHNMPPPCKLTFDLLILKVVSESRVTWATSVPILVFLGLSVLDV